MSTGRILIVEDDPDVSGYLKEFFELEGLEVFTAFNTEEGLALLASQKPSVVLLDMKLGSGASGLEFLRQAKAAKSNAEIIVVSGVSDVNVADMARGLGAAGYLTKPFEEKDLQEIVLSRFK